MFAQIALCWQIDIAYPDNHRFASLAVDIHIGPVGCRDLQGHPRFCQGGQFSLETDVVMMGG